ncbi:MAG: transposase [Candidatus Competibacteraceae bacterium]|nr:transposase [Candidatus Competibacteraceae bacterium]
MDLFPRRGQPAEAPGRLAWVTVLQFVEDLSDRAAADAVRGRLDWKYVLGLELTDPGFHDTVLSEFRSRWVAGQAEQRLLEGLLEQLQEQGLLQAGGRQRTDSTHVLAAVRDLNRLERVGETLRAALNSVAGRPGLVTDVRATGMVRALRSPDCERPLAEKRRRTPSLGGHGSGLMGNDCCRPWRPPPSTVGSGRYPPCRPYVKFGPSTILKMKGCSSGAR